MQSLNKHQPAIFINHGGGPLPILGHQPEVASSLRGLSKELTRPRAILVISAHFESPGDSVCVMTCERPGMLYDYSGFPAQAYSLKYPARIDTGLSDRVVQLLHAAKLKVQKDAKRGFDHGVFVPLMLMYPKADIPLVVMSIPSSGSPSVLTAAGRAVAPLSAEGVLVLGSGASFHNFSAFFRPPADLNGRSEDERRESEWDRWLQDAMNIESVDERTKLLGKWRQAPQAVFAHPTHDHLSPLLVVSAAGGNYHGSLIDKVETRRHTPLHGSQFRFGS